MLQAVTKEGEFVTLALLSRNQLQRVYSQRFFCPECKASVIVKAGKKVIPHFAHRTNSPCTGSRGESAYHMQGKLQLYHWLSKQFEAVQLEPFIDEIRQRPDILLQWRERKIALELQCSKIDPKIIHERNKGYQKDNIIPIWILGANRFKRLGRYKIKIDHFTLQLLQQFSPELPTQLLYYCPQQQFFLKASNLYMTNPHQALSKITFMKTISHPFSQLFNGEFIPHVTLFRQWGNEKEQLRIGRRHMFGLEHTWRTWLYELGCHVEQIPAVIHLPVSCQHLMRVPTWYWQSKFVIEFLAPRPLYSTFSLQQVEQFLRTYQVADNSFPLLQHSVRPSEAYLNVLIRLQMIQSTEKGRYVKIKPILFHNHVEEAMKADKEVLHRLASKK